mgnify:CR=1 FL=1
MKKHEINELSIGELKIKLKDNLEAIGNLRFQKVLQQLEQPFAIKVMRREIAQIHTILKEFELGIRKMGN